jgi:hypothetical protein
MSTAAVVSPTFRPWSLVRATNFRSSNAFTSSRSDVCIVGSTRREREGAVDVISPRLGQYGRRATASCGPSAPRPEEMAPTEQQSLIDQIAGEMAKDANAPAHAHD